MAAPQGLLVQQQLYPSGGGSLEAANGRPPAKQSSIQSADTVSMQYSEPSEDAAAALASSASMQSRPGSKVCASVSFRAHTGASHVVTASGSAARQALDSCRHVSHDQSCHLLACSPQTYLVYEDSSG